MLLRESMYCENRGMNKEELNEELLENLQNRIAIGGRSLAVYGLPAPLIKKSELDFHKLKFPKREASRTYQHLSEVYPLNAEQYEVYSRIVNTVMRQQKNEDRHMFFLNANAGVFFIMLFIIYKT